MACLPSWKQALIPPIFEIEETNPNFATMAGGNDEEISY
jgi:hypothetical protein